jgi:predicted  nucleic acid-binding Zn-ribbon protein
MRRHNTSDASAISLEVDLSDIEPASPDELGWPRAGQQDHGELARIASKHHEREKLLRRSRRFKLVEELVTTERRFVEQLCACADCYETPMRRSDLIQAASPGLCDLMFSDLRHVRRLHVGFANQLEELWDEETSRLDALQIEGVPAEQLQLPVAPFIELLQSLLEGADFIVAYTHWYATPLEERHRPLSRLVRKDTAVRAMIGQLNETSTKDVQFFLRLPLRCLPRYSLLLDALAKEMQRGAGSSPGSGITPDPSATAARQLQAHLERSQKSMAHMGEAIEAARAAACRSVRISILESSDLPTARSRSNGSHSPTNTPKLLRFSSAATVSGPLQHIIEARVVSIRNVDSGSHGQRSKSEKAILSSDVGPSAGGRATTATAVQQPTWAGRTSSGAISKGLDKFGESRLVLKYMQKVKGSKAELVGRAELWLDNSLPHLNWVGWLPWDAIGGGGGGGGGGNGTEAEMGLGAIKLSLTVEVPLDPGTNEKLQLLCGLHGQMPGRLQLQEAEILNGLGVAGVGVGVGGSRGGGSIAESNLCKQATTTRTNSPVRGGNGKGGGGGGTESPRLRTTEERVVIHLEVQLAVLEEELERRTNAQRKLQERVAHSEAEQEAHRAEAGAMQAELDRLRAQVLTRSSSLASVNESMLAPKVELLSASSARSARARHSSATSVQEHSISTSGSSSNAAPPESPAAGSANGDSSSRSARDNGLLLSTRATAVEELHRTISLLREATEQKAHDASLLSGSGGSGGRGSVGAIGAAAAAAADGDAAAAADATQSSLRETEAQLAAAEEKVETLSRAVAVAEAEAYTERNASADLRAEVASLQRKLAAASSEHDAYVAQLRNEVTQLRQLQSKAQQRAEEEAVAMAQRDRGRASSDGANTTAKVDGGGMLLAWLRPLRQRAKRMGFGGGGTWAAVAGGAAVILIVALRARRGRI